MNILRYTAYLLVLVGAINWGLIGFFGYNLVSAIFGDMTILSRIVYSLVGIGAVVSMIYPPVCETFHNNERCECESCDM